MIKFSPANTKLEKLQKRIGKKIYSLDLLSGVTCPHAKDCKSMVVVDKNGKKTIKDGKHCKFRCYSASQEVLLPNVYNLRKHNTEVVRNAKSVSKIAQLIMDSLPNDAEVIRIHVGGDFFSLSYFKAIILVAYNTPHIEWYGYTKANHWLSEYELPSNLRLTASMGGKYDQQVVENGLYASKVVYSRYQARKMGLPVDKDDYLAYKGGQSFALLIHGTQPVGSYAGKRVYKLLKQQKKQKVLTK